MVNTPTLFVEDLRRVGLGEGGGGILDHLTQVAGKTYKLKKKSCKIPDKRERKSKKRILKIYYTVFIKPPQNENKKDYLKYIYIFKHSKLIFPNVVLWKGGRGGRGSRRLFGFLS